MSKLGRTSVLIALSVIYLTFELAFNARLLDVVGSGASPDEVHAIEVYGRTLSGLAAALVVLSMLWNRRATSAGQSPGWPMIIVACTLTVGAVYFALETLVNYAAEQRSAEFRRTSLNILLLQSALVDGKVELDGLTEHPELFTTPQGKAFLALFPAMAVSVDRLDEKIRSAKLSLIERKLRKELGEVKGFHERYQDGVDEIRRKFNAYRRLPTVAIDVDGEVRKQQDKAWEDYLRDLGQRGWTPSTVPPAYERRVVAQVRKRLPVPDSWSPSDEAGFRAAVESQTRRRLAKAPGADGVTINGRKVPPGLDWNEFFAQEAVQAELRRRLELPPGTRLLPAYDNATAFDKAVFRPLVALRAARELRRYDAPASTFGRGGPNEAVGLDAARAVIVPPIALLFSLIGATLHLGKIIFLLHEAVRLRAAGMRPRTTFWQGMALCGTVVATCLVSLRVMDNDITRSNLYVVMNAQLLDEPSPTRQVVSHAMHIIAVGQAYTYPINEAIRTRLLGGITYGYKGKPS
jgi:hypothetical protein